MQITTIMTVVAVAMGVAAAPTAKDPAKEIYLEGSLFSKHQCDEPYKISDWKLNGIETNMCQLFDDHEGVDDYAVRAMQVGKIQSGCALWVYSDAGCHFNATKVQPNACHGGARWYRSYYLACD
ncbi:hypothetical protein NM208_g669 [Fusarium decemcellulare]|uniref:Uncharacterized protein n=1 Tax=Fusarium decemcellulare TaxID=57161 RepID=A0ACC1SYV3_9HYPO|nr:hypothetical protein NM208_g669 [Fusarium decemcellulare]